MAFDLRSLEHFVTVAESGGFARAARQLHLTQPTLSRSIAHLEDALGAKLFTRDTRGTTITDAGTRFLPHAVSILNEVNRARDIFDSGSENRIDQIRLGVSPILLHTGLPEAIRNTLSDCPHAGVVVSTGTRESLISALRSREIDLIACLIEGFLTADRENLQGLVFEEVGHEVILPAARPDHPVFTGEETLEAVARLGWAVPHQMSVSYRFETAFFRRGLPMPIQKLNCASMSLLHRAMLDWSLLGLTPTRLITQDVEAGRLRTLDIPDLHFPYSVTLLTAKDVLLPETCRHLMRGIRDHAATAFPARPGP